MSEQELREGLRAAVAGEPSLNFDADALLARAKREVKRRRALFGAGAATAAVAVAAVAVPTMLGAPRGGGTSAGNGVGWPVGEECASARAPQPPSDPGEITFSVPSTPSRIRVSPPSATPTAMAGPSDPYVVGPAPAGPNVPPEPTAAPCQLSGTPSAPPSSPPPPTSTMSTPPVPAADIRKHARAMQAQLTDVFPQVVPGATKVAVDEFGGEATGAIADGQRHLDTFIGFTLKGERSAVGISVFAPGAGPTPEQACAEGECTMGEGPDGTKIVVVTLASSDQAKIISVSHYRADGSTVRATGHNYDPVGREAPRHLPEVPVTVAQLTALATDPVLGL